MNKEEVKKAVAKLRASLDITCPHCSHDFDLIDSSINNTEGEISIYIFNNRWNELNKMTVICEKCDKEFEIEEVEW